MMLCKKGLFVFQDWTGTSLQLRLTRGVFSDANAIYQMQQSCSPNLTSYPLTTASLVKFYYSVMY